MNDKRFLDTNVLVYAYDTSEPTKQEIALTVLDQAFTEDSGTLSVQVLGEFYSVVTRKIRNPMSSDEALRAIRLFSNWEVGEIDYSLVLAAVDIQGRYPVNYWDALILAAAHRQGCPILLTEDLSQGQRYDDVEVVNPFLKGDGSQ